MKNGTVARAAKAKDPGGLQKKQVTKLAVAREKAERKVVRLRERLTRAENKLAKRTAKLDAAGAGTVHEMPPVVEAASPAAEPVIGSAPPANLSYDGERETSAARADTRRNSRPRPKNATAPVPAVKTRKVHRNSHAALPASAAITDGDGSGAE